MQIIDFGNAVNYGSEQFFMYSMIVTECFHNKCFKLSTLCSVYIPWGCELDMILSVMTSIYCHKCCQNNFKFPPKNSPKIATIAHVHGLLCLLARGPHMLPPQMPPVSMTILGHASPSGIGWVTSQSEGYISECAAGCDSFFCHG